MLFTCERDLDGLSYISVICNDKFHLTLLMCMWDRISCCVSFSFTSKWTAWSGSSATHNFLIIALLVYQPDPDIETCFLDWSV